MANHAPLFLNIIGQEVLNDIERKKQEKVSALAKLKDELALKRTRMQQRAEQQIQQKAKEMSEEEFKQYLNDLELKKKMRREKREQQRRDKARGTT